MGTASVNFMEFRGIRPRMYMEDLLDKVTLTLLNVSCYHRNNKMCDCSKIKFMAFQ